jgi:hypothetical protein
MSRFFERQNAMPVQFPARAYSRFLTPKLWQPANKKAAKGGQKL